MKKLTILLYLMAIIFNTNALAKDLPKKVFISQVVEHPALNQTAKGIIDGLAQNGYIRNQNIDIRIESAQANQALASQIASKFVNQSPDVVVGLGTISAQSFANYAIKNKANLIFSSVTDPIQAGLVKTISKPENNTSGVSNFIDLKPQIQLFKKIQPNLKRLGILYNPAELNSISIVKQLEKLSTELHIVLIKQTANKTADISQAATKLANNVDAIFISNDNTALSALQTIILISNKAKIPVYVSDTDAVAFGALASLGPNQYQIGLQTAKLIARSLQGEKTGSIPVEYPKKMDIYLNQHAACALNITIPNDIKAQATKIIK